jgi:hypothetical protein
MTNTSVFTPTQTGTIAVGVPVATLTLTSTQPLTPAATATLTSPPPNVIFSDDFTAWSDANWNAFGPPGMVVVNGRLELTSSQPGEAGLFSKTRIPLRQGTVVQFDTGSLSSTQSTPPLQFDWVSITQTNGPIQSVGFMRLEVTNDQAVITIGTNVITIPLEDKATHAIEVQIIRTRRVAFLIDDKKTELDLLVSPQDGYISFSGNGWVDDLLVTGP